MHAHKCRCVCVSTHTCVPTCIQIFICTNTLSAHIKILSECLVHIPICQGSLVQAGSTEMGLCCLPETTVNIFKGRGPFMGLKMPTRVKSQAPVSWLLTSCLVIAGQCASLGMERLVWVLPNPAPSSQSPRGHKFVVLFVVLFVRICSAKGTLRGLFLYKDAYD